jgi:hypothetical protein
MRARMSLALLGVVLGALEVAGGAQELIYQGIFRSRTFPLIAGTLGTVAGALLLAAGVALLLRLQAAKTLAEAAAYVSVPVFITIGVVTHVAGWPITAAGILLPVLLLGLSRKWATA